MIPPRGAEAKEEVPPGQAKHVVLVSPVAPQVPQGAQPRHPAEGRRSWVVENVPTEVIKAPHDRADPH